MADVLSGLVADEGTAAPAEAAATPDRNSGTEAAKAAPAPEAAQKGEQPEAKGDQAKAETAPAPIEVKLPEGVEVAPELLEAIKGTAKDGESAQKLADAYVAAQKTADEKLLAAWDQQQAEWAAATRADKEIGGTFLKQTVIDGEKAARTYGSEAFRDLLISKGLNHHPEVVRFLARAGKAIKEDSIAGAQTTEAPQPSLASLLYPNSPGLK